MPEGPLGGPRPAAESHIKVNITLESFHVSEDDVEQVSSGMPLNNQLFMLFEEELDMQIKNLDVTSSGARAVDITLRSDTAMLYKSPGTNKINIVTEWFEDNIGPVTSVSVIAE